MSSKLIKEVLIVLLVFGAFQGYSQSVKRQSVASAGTSVPGNKVLVQQTIGQPYATKAYYSDKVSVRPGFQQPAGFKAELISTTFKNLDLDIYPNPATYEVNISSSEAIVGALVCVVDMNGKLILKEQIDELVSHRISCDTWSNGVYVISVYSKENNTYSSKLIINK